ncbi:nuclear transport factor 2 family protein [Kineococcus sp. GCM10028916]|uniref:nuclear transport factor 2 family protein n=1 Tax=Kineococcus sp. GCM10028916 TaxID=3273394 RepID=UPI00362DDD6B
MNNTTTSTTSPADAGTPDATTTDAALAHLLDQLAVRDTIARFADCATHADFDAFATLWAPDATWVIGGTEDQPFERRAEGAEDITALFRSLREERDYFIQFVTPGVVEVDGDVATARSLCHEAARGPGERYYRTNGVWTDTFRRAGERWVFTNRTYRYLWLDFSAFSGDVSWGGDDAK